MKNAPGGSEPKAKRGGNFHFGFRISVRWNQASFMR